MGVRIEKNTKTISCKLSKDIFTEYKLGEAKISKLILDELRIIRKQLDTND